MWKKAIKNFCRLLGYEVVAKHHFSDLMTECKQFRAEHQQLQKKRDELPTLGNFEARFKRQQEDIRGKLAPVCANDYRYWIDVVGSCSLRCPSCPVGNYQGPGPAKVKMKVETFAKIVEKIKQSHPPSQKVLINPFNWGEPIFHPQIDEIIQICRQYGFACGLSSTLNHSPNLEKIVKAGPTFLRISLSGYYNATYSRTHRRGNIYQVKSNMFLLRNLLDQTKSETLIQVGYHLYKHNVKEDSILLIKLLCHELDFLLFPQIAMLFPLEKTVDAASGTITQGDKEIHDLLLITPQKWKTDLAPLRTFYPDCKLRRTETAINADGTVSLCCGVYDQKNNIAENFLDISHEELQARKYSHPFCQACQKQSLDLMCSGIKTDYAASLMRKILKSA